MSINALLITLCYLLLTLLPIAKFGTPFNTLMVLLALWHGLLIVKKQTGVRNSILNGIAIIGMAITVVSIGLHSTVSIFVALLLLACQLKVLQAKTTSQWRQILVLNFFTLPCIFLFSQSLYIALLVMIMLGLNLSFMLQLQKVGSFKAVSRFVFSKMILSCVLSIFLLLFLPKLPAFWQLPGPQLAKTGLSENVSPFSIAQLSQSDELAFRAVFASERLQQSQAPLYWRAIIHNKFDGKQWTIANFQKAAADLQKNIQSEPYTVIAEPSNTPWLYALDLATSPTTDVQSNPYGTLYRTNKLSSTFEYIVEPANDDIITNISGWQYRINTALPKNVNPKAQNLAKQWGQSSNTTAQFISLMRRYFQDQGFSYTLTPQVATSEHMIDQFLFEYKSGFCGHYASTAAMMMRSAGIPARLVSGYLGAEYNQEQGYYSVYQYDAHAWVEYFVPNEGWKRIDPTAWVSPQRLLGSLSQYQPLANEFQSNLGISLAAWSGFPAINWLRLQLEQIDYQWTRWVLNFDQQKQSSLLKSLFGDNAKQLSGIIVIILLCIIFCALFFYAQYKKVIKEPLVIRLYRQLIALSQDDLSHTPPKKAIVILQQQFAQDTSALAQFYADFAANRYQGKTFGKDQSEHAKKLINSIKTKSKRKI
ncbi:Protein-glutamine gamma-glutamyltransferase [Pseudoalteromonas holothuriae]|uniref:Protein-glutamine gamma-glutamyltransferase n=1 Tax=Pseudoalteromonas holothuriae TaxID=2963714 RepID=A0ABM9GJQ3_9GAMM|nr:DUF3488 and transglutaminase-like domain-containing protein [Pseudoalteromonas sp. CIP111951]CAH9061972.1 Protein-glutamine gamma-glutamyltransferase [Pseudoalteromonas sp. CIP111951]